MKVKKQQNCDGCVALKRVNVTSDVRKCKYGLVVQHENRQNGTIRYFSEDLCPKPLEPEDYWKGYRLMREEAVCNRKVKDPYQFIQKHEVTRLVALNIAVEKLSQYPDVSKQVIAVLTRMRDQEQARRNKEMKERSEITKVVDER